MTFASLWLFVYNTVFTITIRIQSTSEQPQDLEIRHHPQVDQYLPNFLIV